MERARLSRPSRPRVKTPQPTPSSGATSVALADRSLRGLAPHLVAFGACLLAGGFVVGAVLFSRPADAATPPTETVAAPQPARLNEAADELATTERSLLGGDRHPNWWAKRGAAIQVSSDQLVGTRREPATNVDTLAAFQTEHLVGPLSFRAHARWRELPGTSRDLCAIVDDGSVPSMLSVLIFPASSRPDLDRFVSRLRARMSEDQASVSSLRPCHEKIGASSAKGLAFDFAYGAEELTLRAFDIPASSGERAFVILRAPKGPEAAKALAEVLATIR
jgi:hypothetical protein